SSRCFSPGSFAVLSGAAHFDFAQYKPPPFRIFALLRLSASDGQAGGSLPCRQAGSPPVAAKCVRANSRIVHHNFKFAS
ncbi:MAG: hypothetical protein AAB428_03105, partial [Patescibacteria group bacterium]